MTRSIFVLILVGIVSFIGPTGQATAGTDPGAIPDLLMWLKADAGVEDASGNPVAQGSNVAVWRDQSGNGWDAVAPDPRIGPTLETNADLNGAAVVRWPDGELDDNGVPIGLRDLGGFAVDAGSLAEGQEATYVVVFQAENLALNRRFINFTGAGTFRNYSKGPGSDPRYVGPFGNPIGYAGSLGVNQSARYSVLRQRENNLEHFVDGVADTFSVFYNADPANAPEGTWALAEVTNLDIGIQTPHGNPYVGDMAEIMIFGRALGDEELAGLQPYMFQRYGIPEPASLMLLAMGGLMLTPLRRRR
jgi:hypothetical protein